MPEDNLNYKKINNLKNEFINKVVATLFTLDEDSNPISINSIKYKDEKIIFKYLNPKVDNVKIKANDVLIFHEINKEIFESIFSEKNVELIYDATKQENKDELVSKIISNCFKDVLFLKPNKEKRSDNAIDNSLDIISKFLQIKKYNQDERTFDEWVEITKEDLRSFIEESDNICVLIAFFFISYFIINN